MFKIDPFKKKSQRETGKKGVETDFVTAVSRAGGKAYKFTSENNRGVSDRLVIFPGQVWFVEIKREDTDLSPLQVVFKNFILQNNLNHFVVYGKPGIKQFLQEVSKYDKCRKA
jgi:hypothetical protein